MSLIENYGPNVVARSPAAGVRMTRTLLPQSLGRFIECENCFVLVLSNEINSTVSVYSNYSV